MEQEQARRSNMDTPLLERRWVVVALTAVACALWGSAFAFVKLGYQLFGITSGEPASQLLFAGMRFTLAGLMVLAGATVARRGVPIPTRTDVVPILALALTQTTLQYAPFYVGLAHASGTNASLVQGSSAFISIIIATLVFRQERLTPRKFLGCALGLGGVALVTLRSGNALGSFTILGEGLVLASVTCGAVATCLLRRFGVGGGDPIKLTGYQFLLGGVALCVIALVTGGHISSFSPQALFVLLYLGALSATAFSIWSALLKHNPVSHIAIFRFLIPIFGVLFSLTFLGETANPSDIPIICLALALITCATVLVNTEARKE